MANKLPAAAAPNVASLKKPRSQSAPSKPGRFDDTSAARDLAVRVAEAGILDTLSVDEAIAALTAAAEQHRAQQAAPVRGQGRRGERGIAMHGELRDRAHAAERVLAHAQDRAPSTASFVREAVTIFLAHSTAKSFDHDAVAAMIATPDGTGADTADDVLATSEQIARDFDALARDENAYQSALPGRRDAYMSVTFAPRLDSEVRTYLASDAARAAGIKSAAALVRLAVGMYARHVEAEADR